MTVSPPTRWRQSVPALVATVAARVLLGALVLLVLVSVVPALAGWQSTVVTSGSMAPAVQAGDVTVVRPVDAADLRPGQVLLVDDPDLPGALRLHRLVALEDGGLRLQGDANPRPDTTLVAPAAVHGVAALRLPDLGLPVLWAMQGRWLPLSAVVLGLAALVGAAQLYRSPAGPGPGAGTDDTPPEGGRPRRRGARRAVPAGTAVLAVVVLLVGLPGTTGARFSATTANHANTFAANRYFSCALAAAGAGLPAFYGFQSTTNNVATNTGTAGTVANGRFAGGVSSVAGGPAGCGANGTRAVRFDGTSGVMYTSYPLDNPQTFSLQMWFSTTTSDGGLLIGFGLTADGTASGQHDRHVYMTNSGKLTFGVYSGAIETTTTERSYNDGAWHLMTATFSPTTGLRLYVDGALQASRRSTTSAEPYTGYWRVGYNTISDSWPAAPRSDWFNGLIANVGFDLTVLSATEIADQWSAGT